MFVSKMKRCRWAELLYYYMNSSCCQHSQCTCISKILCPKRQVHKAMKKCCRICNSTIKKSRLSLQSTIQDGEMKKDGEDFSGEVQLPKQDMKFDQSYWNLFQSVFVDSIRLGGVLCDIDFVILSSHTSWYSNTESVAYKIMANQNEDEETPTDDSTVLRTVVLAQ